MGEKIRHEKHSKQALKNLHRRVRTDKNKMQQQARAHQLTGGFLGCGVHPPATSHKPTVGTRMCKCSCIRCQFALRNLDFFILKSTF